MTTTVNISLPEDMYKDAKKKLTSRRYTSVSELVRDALRKLLYEEKLTVNGFTREFEDAVLESEAEPEENDTIWEKEEDIINYFKKLDKKIAHKVSGLLVLPVI